MPAPVPTRRPTPIPAPSYTRAATPPPAPTPAPSPSPTTAEVPTAFGVGLLPLAGLGQAVAWRPGLSGMSGTQANLRVTATYQALDEAMTKFLGEPLLPNWMTFGKYASREVGSQVIRLEELMKLSAKLDPEAAHDTLKDFFSDSLKLGGQAAALLKVSRGNPFAAARNATTIRDALVAGNTGVYGDIAPAYDTFLKAEAAGRDGLAAMRDRGYGRAPKDPQGLLLEAFTLYQRAAREKATLDPAERRALVQRATLTLGNHEQMVVLQGPQMFGNFEVSRLLSSLSSLLSVTDARGTERLLPHGGNWSDFATRMGYDDVAADTPGAMRVIDHQGGEHHFIPSRDPKRWDGTIGKYFVEGMAPAAAKVISEGRPAPLPSAYDDVPQLQDTWTKLKGLLLGSGT